jgi:hypothetical protein
MGVKGWGCEADRSPLSSPRSRMMVLYLHFLICLDDILLNQSIRGRTLPIPYIQFETHISPPPPPVALEHRTSVKRFVSLQFLNPKTVCRTPWMGDQPFARPLPTQTE